LEGHTIEEAGAGGAVEIGEIKYVTIRLTRMPPPPHEFLGVDGQGIEVNKRGV